MTEQVKANLLLQLDLFQKIYEVTGSLAKLCNENISEMTEVKKLLDQRSKLIEELKQVQKDAAESLQSEPTKADTEIVRSEIRSVLAKTTALDQQVREKLQQYQGEIKQDLVRFQAGKRAGAAYNTTPTQLEGFFIDSKKN